MKKVLAICCVCVICAITIGYISFTYYSTSHRQEKRIDDTFRTVLEITDNQTFNSLQIDKNAEELIKMREKVQLLEQSLDPENSKWSKIKKVRETVKTAIKEFGYNSYMNTMELTEYSSAVVEWSEQYDVEIPLILAISMQESAFNPRARSKAGAMGVMQLMPETARDIGTELNMRYYNMYKVGDNVKFGVYYIMKVMNDFDHNVFLSVRAYNCGPTYVRRVVAGEYERFPAETVDYAERILGTEEQIGFLDYFRKMGL